MVTSKDVFAQLEDHIAEFRALGQDWCDNDTVVSAAKARSYGKKIINALRNFTDLTIVEEVNIKNTPVPTQPEVVVTPSEILQSPSEEVPVEAPIED